MQLEVILRKLSCLRKVNAAFHLQFLDFKIVYAYLMSKFQCSRGPEEWQRLRDGGLGRAGWDGELLRNSPGLR